MKYVFMGAQLCDDVVVMCVVEESKASLGVWGLSLGILSGQVFIIDTYRQRILLPKCFDNY